MNVIWTPQPRQRVFMQRKENDAESPREMSTEYEIERKGISYGKTHEKTHALNPACGGSNALTAGPEDE